MGLSVLPAACTPAAVPWDPRADGVHATGVWRGKVANGERELPTTVWYPSSASATSVLLPSLAEQETTYAALLHDAPADCPTRALPMAVQGAVAEGVHGLVVFSHCHTCLGISGATIAARLATHGWVVAAPDHVGNTLFDELRGAAGEVDNATLDLRSTDVQAVLDAVLSGNAGPAGLKVDPDRLVAAGHSFGAMTAGRVLADRPELAAGVYLAAPPTNPLYATADVATLDRPAMFVIAQEDNSITELGNSLLRTNLAASSLPALGIEIADAGHWSVSDLVGLVPDFDPGCGDGLRQTDGSAFTYADPATMRASTATEVLTFLEAVVGDRDEAWMLLRADGAGRTLRETP